MEDVISKIHNYTLEEIMDLVSEDILSILFKIELFLMLGMV